MTIGLKQMFPSKKLFRYQPVFCSRLCCVGAKGGWRCQTKR